MPRFDVITLFPEMFHALTGSGITSRGYRHGLYQLQCWNPRDFADDAHKTIDDRPYGGGPGMVMMCGPLVAAIRAAKADRQDNAPIIYLSPAGERLTQQKVHDWALRSVVDGLVLVCGRYEGIDQRVIDLCVDAQVSLGDFVLSGGELPAMALMDAWLRLLPGMMNDAQSAIQESFVMGGLDHPHYTRPEVFEGLKVPEVLLSGNHGKIEGWREAAALDLTRKHRPDLLPFIETPPSAGKT